MAEYIDNLEEDEDGSPSLEECVENIYHNNGNWEYEFDGYPFTDTIELYNQSLLYEDNFRDGKKMKFLLLPLFKDQNDNNKNFTPCTSSN